MNYTYSIPVYESDYANAKIIQKSITVDKPATLAAVCPKINKNEKAFSQSQFNSILNIAKRNNNDVLEFEDLNANEKIAYAKAMGYDEMYKIEVSALNPECYEITINNPGLFSPNPSAKNVKNDFGIGDGILSSYNEDLFSVGTNLDEIKIGHGTTLTVPVNAVTSLNGVSGFWSRL